MRRAAGFVLASLLVGLILASVLWNLAERLGIGLAGAMIVLVGLLLLGRLRGATSGRGDGNADEGDGWSIVSGWQYEGRFAEAGGVIRSEQDQASEVDEQARAETNRE